MFHQILEQGKFAAGIVITFQVMAFSGVSPGDPDTVCALTQRCQKEFGIHPPGAGNADDPDIGRIFHPADAGKISGAITAPIAQESCNFWFPIRHCYLSPYYWILDARFWMLDYPVPITDANIKYRVSGVEYRKLYCFTQAKDL